MSLLSILVHLYVNTACWKESIALVRLMKPLEYLIIEKLQAHGVQDKILKLHYFFFLPVHVLTDVAASHLHSAVQK